jgi:hypothetical protein
LEKKDVGKKGCALLNLAIKISNLNLAYILKLLVDAAVLNRVKKKIL